MCDNGFLKEETKLCRKKKQKKLCKKNKALEEKIFCKKQKIAKNKTLQQKQNSAKKQNFAKNKTLQKTKHCKKQMTSVNLEDEFEAAADLLLADSGHLGRGCRDDWRAEVGNSFATLTR